MSSCKNKYTHTEVLFSLSLSLSFLHSFLDRSIESAALAALLSSSSPSPSPSVDDCLPLTHSLTHSPSSPLFAILRYRPGVGEGRSPERVRETIEPSPCSRLACLTLFYFSALCFPSPSRCLLVCVCVR